MRRLAHILLVGILSAIVPGALAAQEVERDSARTCIRAVSIIERGRPVRTEAWAYAYLAHCGSTGATALARGMVAMRLETDIQALDEFTWQVDNWRDATLMDAAARLATDDGASVPARVFAVRHLLTILLPYRVFSYEGLTVRPEVVEDKDLEIYRPGCHSSLVSHGPSLTGMPQPADAEAQVRKVLAGLQRDSTTAEPIRLAAACGN